jgi:hypothetical protein
MRSFMRRPGAFVLALALVMRLRLCVLTIPLVRGLGLWIGEVILVGLRDLSESFPRIEQLEGHFLKCLVVTRGGADLAFGDRADRTDPVDPYSGIKEALHVSRDRTITR